MSVNIYSLPVFSKNDLYEKIDLFGEVLENIKKDYVDDVDQAEMMDSAINGVLQSLDPYSAYMSPELFKEMQTDTSGEFGGLGIEIGMEAGVVKVISPIDDTPAEKAGIKAGDYIVKIGKEQVQGKSLMEAVKLMRGPVGTSIDLTIRRKNVKKPLEFKITRKIIEVRSVNSEIISEENAFVHVSGHPNRDDLKDMYFNQSRAEREGALDYEIDESYYYHNVLL